MKYLGPISDSKSHVTKEYVDGNILVLQTEKQDKEEGKGLSSNDYSDSDKSKVDSLVNVVQAVATGDVLDDVEVDYATKEYVDSEFATKAEHNSLNERVTALEEEEGSSVTVDTELSETSENAISNSAVTRAMAENEEVTAAALNELNERVNEISENVSGETATKVELQDAVTSLTNTILENEEITAAALNDLNTRLNEILTRLNNAGI